MFKNTKEIAFEASVFLDWWVRKLLCVFFGLVGKEIDLKASFVLDWCSDRFVDVLVRWVSGGLSRQSDCS